MGKLTQLKPTLGVAPPTLGRATDDHGHAKASEPWRNWYKLARWAKLKKRVHLRDGYVCQRTGVICAGKGNDWNAPVANHIRAHRGDPTLFWDEDNVETVTKQHHDSVIQADEARQRAAGLL